MKYFEQIFGQDILFNVAPAFRKQVKQSLSEQMDLYPDAESRSADAVVNIVESLDLETLARNPASHIETDNGFAVNYGKFSIHYSLDDDGHFVGELKLRKEKNRLLSYLKKLNNIQYDSVFERIGQILFENVLVPSVYFKPGIAPVHSAAVKGGDAGTLLIGGTGGVGKTSLELELCRERKFAFLSDDIAIIDSEARIYPNLSFPKIYGYNLESRDDVKEIIFEEMPVHDRLAWAFKYRLFGPSRVRRKISPEKLYRKVRNTSAAIDRYFILVRENVDELGVEPLDAELAAQSTLQIMKTEYSNFNNHLYWHKHNCLMTGRTPIVDIDEVFDRWLELYRTVFGSIETLKLSIPLTIDHGEFLRKAGQIVADYN